MKKTNSKEGKSIVDECLIDANNFWETMLTSRIGKEITQDLIDYLRSIADKVVELRET